MGASDLGCEGEVDLGTWRVRGGVGCPGGRNSRGKGTEAEKRGTHGGNGLTRAERGA